jgi:hypothetical protein
MTRTGMDRYNGSRTTAIPELLDFFRLPGLNLCSICFVLVRSAWVRFLQFFFPHIYLLCVEFEGKNISFYVK